MDTAPLTSAHTSVRNTVRSPEDALLHHTAAADEFAQTALDVQDTEALRILSLLEQEHRRLARLVQSRTQPKLRTGVSLDESLYEMETSAVGGAPPQASINAAETKLVAPGTKRQSSPVFERRQVRLMSSSIANNLASARGIPTAPHRQTRYNKADEKGMSGTMSGQKSTESSPGAVDVDRSEVRQTANFAPRDGKDIPGEDPFQRFYSGFEGLWSKLSAPLAFAGLPLMPETHAQEGLDQSMLRSTSHHQRGEPIETPQIDSIYSKAAMQAIREDRGPVSHPQESFYVVPDQSRSGAAHVGQYDEDDRFEDARESPQLGSPLPNNHILMTAQTNVSGKTIEELVLENASLKTLTDNLSKRLYMWEKNAQNQTAAMQQSIRTLQPLHTNSDLSSMSPLNDVNIKQLEEQLRAMQKELDQQHRENIKLKTVVVRYRERWDKLKEGARVRREGTERGTEAQATELG